MAHSLIGASSCERWWNCPGSVGLIAGLPDSANTSSRYAAEGTLAHTLAERCLTSGDLSVDRFLDDEEQVDDYDFVVTDDMVEAVRTYLDFAMAELESRELALKDAKVETKFNLKHLHKEAFGTCDLIIHDDAGGELLVIDYKHGAGVKVWPNDNKQLKYYALGAYHELDRSQKINLLSVELIIVQPRVSGYEAISRFTISKKDLLEFEKALKEKIDLVMKERDLTLASGDWCKFCPAKHGCPELRGAVESVVKIGDLTQSANQNALPKPQEMTPQQIGVVLDNAAMVKEWVDSVQRHAYLLASEKLQKIPGYKLVERRSNRKFIDVDKVIERYDLEFGEKLYGEPKLISPAGLEKLLGKNRKGELTPLVVKPPAGTTLVKDEDSKPEVQAKHPFAGFEIKVN